MSRNFVGTPVVIDQDTDLGSMVSPLVKFFDPDAWAYVVWPKDEVKEVRAWWEAGNRPTISYFKDQGIHAWYLEVDGKVITRQEFDKALHAEYRLNKGIAYAGKAISRYSRFVKFSVVLPRVRVAVNDLYAYQATDGRHLISREFAIACMFGIDPDAKHMARAIAEIERGDLFEITIADPVKGQLKGIAEVSALVPNGVDMLASANKDGLIDWKPMVKWDFGGNLVTLVPVHNDDRPYTDIQTLINNIEPVGMLPVDLVLDWTRKDAMEYLHSVADGSAYRALGDLSSIDIDDFVRWEQRRAEGMGRSWPLKLAALSGCNTIFPRFVQQLGDQWIQQINGGGKFKVTNRSGAYAFVTPSEAVGRGKCMYNRHFGWLVNPDEAVVKSGRNERSLVDAAGTADFDDKFEGWVFKSKNGKLYVLLVRKPNGPDEKYLLEFEGEYPEHWEIPTLKVSSFHLPKIAYGEMQLADPLIKGYDALTNEAIRVEQFDDAAVLFEASKRNISLGSTVNWVMLETGATGKAPKFMKLAVSDVTDIAQTGKHSLSADDVEQYNGWLKNQFKRVVATTKIPAMLLDRIPESLRAAAAIETDENHPINRLAAGVERIKQAYNVALSAVVNNVTAPDLGSISTHYMAEAQRLVELWGQFWGNEALMDNLEGDVDLSPFWAKVEPVFDAVPEDHRDLLVLSLAKLVYARGMVERDGIKKWRDGLLFAVKTGGKGMGDRLIEAMQSRGLMNDFTFDSVHGLIVMPRRIVPEEPQRVSVAVNGIMHTLGMTISRQLVEAGEVGDDDTVLKALADLVKAENKRIQAGKKSRFSTIIVSEFAFSDGKPRKGIYIDSEIAHDAMYRIGVLPDEYSFLAVGRYEVSSVAMHNRQMMVVLK